MPWCLLQQDWDTLYGFKGSPDSPRHLAAYYHGQLLSQSLSIFTWPNITGLLSQVILVCRLKKKPLCFLSGETGVRNTKTRVSWIFLSKFCSSYKKVWCKYFTDPMKYNLLKSLVASLFMLNMNILKDCPQVLAYKQWTITGPLNELIESY